MIMSYKINTAEFIIFWANYHSVLPHQEDFNKYLNVITKLKNGSDGE